MTQVFYFSQLRSKWILLFNLLEIYNSYKGAATEPWGTSQLTKATIESKKFISIYCLRWDK